MKEMKRMGGGIRGTVLGLERRGFCMFMGGIQNAMLERVDVKLDIAVKFYYFLRQSHIVDRAIFRRRLY